MADSVKKIYWSVFENRIGPMLIGVTDKGLCYVGSPGGAFEVLENWARKNYKNAILVENDEAVELYKAELSDYLEGNKQFFSCNLDFQGSPFQESVWAALGQIPYGQTASYSDIAHLIGKPSAVRAVGSAIGANPVLMAIPCHRIIGKNGAITGYRGGVDMKQILLQLEAAGTP